MVVLMTEKQLGSRIRRLRVQRGLTAAQAGQALGISKQAWNQWETSERSPRISSLKKISQVLGTTPALLLSQEEQCS